MSLAVPSRSLEPAPFEQATLVAVVGALSATTMLFASLVSAYLVRRAFDDWRPSSAWWPFPLLVFALCATAGLEIASRSEGQGRRRGFQTLALATALYLAGACWVIVSIATAAETGSGLGAPHNAFVVLLLGVHVVHAAFGVAFSTWILRAGGRSPSQNSLLLTRLVTHFLTALLFAVVFVLFVLR